MKREEFESSIKRNQRYGQLDSEIARLQGAIENLEHGYDTDDLVEWLEIKGCEKRTVIESPFITVKKLCEIIKPFIEERISNLEKEMDEL